MSVKVILNFGVNISKVWSRAMSKWGDYSKEDYDNETKETRRRLDEQNQKVRQGYEDLKRNLHEEYQRYYK